MKFTERDHLLVLGVEKLVGVELDEWQRRVLVAMVSAHREFTLAPGRCQALSPALEQWGGARLQCEKGPEHERDEIGVSDSRHEARPPRESFPIVWMDDVRGL